MAADKEIMRQIETLRLDRPGRVYAAGAVSVMPAFGPGLIAALTELAATYREEAALWAKSGAKGWKGSEAEKYLVAQHIDDVAAQLDNAGGGAALSVSVDVPGITDADIEAELRESAKRIDGVRDLAGLDALIADSVAERRGHVRDDLLPDGHPARSNAMIPAGSASAILAQTVSNPDDVLAYLKGEANDIPGTPPLTPGSVASAPELGDPFAPPGADRFERVAAENDLGVFGLDETGVDGPTLIEAMPDVSIPRQTDAMPQTWESETMTADGHRPPGLAPLLGQPGDAGAGYSHDYVPAGGRRFTYAELLTPVPAASLPPHLSHSQGNTIGDCAAKYRLQRVEQLPQVPQWANVGGSAFHAAVEAIERTMVNALAAGRPLSLDGYDVELGWKEHFEAEIAKVSASSPVPVSVWRSSRKGAEGRQWWEVNGPLMLRRYLDARPAEHTANLPASPDAINGAVDPFQLAIELDLTVDVPTPYGPIPFNAKLDRVTNGPDASDGNWITLVIRDYKTSYERPTDTTQLGDYANVLRLWGVPESVKILGTYFDARRGEWTTPVDLLAAHPFEAFQYRVTTAYAQRRALTTGPTPARPSSYCGGCSVRYACPIMAAKS
ncbi:MAG TPA: PD-(D/E)XK nuclease family protein [Acidimicrobiales bacterium]|nr:PD-(D/E)XK nuclease family protein [Acidimicrobiales bacterium]